MINGGAVNLDSETIRNKIGKFTENQDLSNIDHSRSKYLSDNGENNIEIIVPVSESEVFLSNLKKIVMNARIA